LIARVALSPLGLVELSEGTPELSFERLRRYRDLVELLDRHGALVLSDDSDRSFLQAAIVEVSRRSPDSGTALRELLKKLQARNRVVSIGAGATGGIDVVENGAQLQDPWGDHTDIAVLTRKAAELFGLTDVAASVVEPTSNVEVTTAERAAQARRFARLAALRDGKSFTAGSPRDEFWDEVLEPMLRLSRSVALVDRFLFGWLHRRRDDDPRADGWEPGALSWLLTKIDALPGEPRTVTLMAARRSSQHGGFPDTAAAVRALLEQVWTPANGGIGTIEILAPGYATTLPHPRQLHCDAGPIVHVDAGFEAFERPLLQKDLVWNFYWTNDRLQSFADDRDDYRTQPSVDELRWSVG
jgi:hypothetical protein